MSQLVKATLSEVTGAAGSEQVGDSFDVQFNPASLKLQLSNKVEGAQSQGRQVRQYVGSSSSTFKLDLVFDSADEGTTEQPMSVLEKTAVVERFIKPQADGGQSSTTPPRMRFEWGDVIIVGVVESIDLELDLFAPSGVPLRAKVGVTMKEQNAEFQLLEVGPAAKTNGEENDQVAAALDGETAAEFAARVGIDPAAWRGLDINLSAGLSLEAGLEIGFSAGLSAGVGIGVNVGIEAGVDLSLEASIGLEVSASASASASLNASAEAKVSTGQALAAAGGVSTAIDSVQIAKATAAADSARAAFSVPASSGSSASVTAGSSSSATSTTASSASSSTSSSSSAVVSTTQSVTSSRPGPPQQSRTPLSASGVQFPTQQALAPSAPPLPKIDGRAASYGFGVPLRPIVAVASESRSGSVTGSVNLRSKTTASQGSLFRTNPTVPPWVQLPPHDSGRAIADQAQQISTKPCGCHGPCTHTKR